MKRSNKGDLQMMGEEKTKIYSKRFPIPTDEELHKIEVKDDSLSAEQFIQLIKETEQKIPNPDKIKRKDDFLKFAKNLADVYCVDLDIYEDSCSYTVDLLLPVATYYGGVKRTMECLIVLSDEIYVHPPKEEDGDYLVKFTLTYYTHDIYFNGKKIN